MVLNEEFCLIIKIQLKMLLLLGCEIEYELL